MSNGTEFHIASPQGIVVATLCLVCIYYIFAGLYNVFLHPLRKVPGPKLAALSRFPHSYHVLKGDIVWWLKDLHDKYGDAVRIAPTEVSFSSGDTAWQDIYGFHTGESQRGRHFLKDRTFFTESPNKTWSIILSGVAEHTRMRRVVAHAFSDKALREQESLIQTYVARLLNCVREEIAVGTGVMNMVDYYTFFTLDVISDLSFGRSFNCLEDENFHALARGAVASAKAVSISSVRERYPLIKTVHELIRPGHVEAARRKFFYWVKGQVDERLNTETSRPDFIHHILKHTNSEKGLALSRDEIDSNAVLFMAAGSETTATTLTGVTVLLLQNPEKMAKLKEEIRGKFTSSSDITVDAVFQLPYLIATLQEALRFYPPVGHGFPRIVPKGGATISNHFVPAGSSVSVTQYAANHSARNWASPESYIPERWLEDRDPKFDADKRSAMQPFSFGPRVCLGKNLAFAEMRVLLARLVFEYDMEFAQPLEKDWFQQRNFLLWEKKPVMIKFTPVKTEA